jgi:HNH endonuclease
MSHTRRNSWSAIATIGHVRKCAILLRSGLRCAWCGVELDRESAQVDHVVPRCQGGEDVNGNMIASCPDCNAPAGTARYRHGAYRPRTPEIAAVLAAPVDLRAGRALALEWYPTLAARFEDQRRRARERKARASIVKHGVPGGAAFPFGANAEA